MSFLLDTNIVSELRHGDRANPGVVEWLEQQSARELFVSAITVGEIRQGIEQLRSRNARVTASLDRWLKGLGQFYEDRMIYVDGDIAEESGRLCAASRAVPVVDALLAATARVHDLTVVTRNERDFAGFRVRVVNPFRPT